MTEVMKARLTTATIAFVGVAVGAGLMLLLLRQVIEFIDPRGDNSDPIVVDNSDLRIFRRDNEPPDEPKDGYWPLENSNAFERLVGTAQYLDAATQKHFCHDIDEDVSSVDVVEFWSKGSKVFDIKRVGREVQVYPYTITLQPDSEQDLKNKAHKKYYKKLKPTISAPAHIDQVKYGSNYLCLGSGMPKKQSAPCSPGNSLPADVRLVIRPL